MTPAEVEEHARMLLAQLWDLLDALDRMLKAEEDK